MRKQKVIEKLKTISLLATGDELIDGDIQNTNSPQFAKILTTLGAAIFQHMQTSDKKSEIKAALAYLLQSSDAVIMTGGLGPTSDDNTRFALAEMIQQELVFNEEVWQDIEAHFKRRNFPMAASNRQQALFPKGAILYPNLLGTAWGCEMHFQNKRIFMLPGPPKECVPLFEQYVLPSLEAAGFLKQKNIYRWLTQGLIEGEISTQIDEIVKPYGLETGYCWMPPHLEIKIISYHRDIDAALLARLNVYLKEYLSVDAH